MEGDGRGSKNEEEEEEEDERQVLPFLLHLARSHSYSSFLCIRTLTTLQSSQVTRKQEPTTRASNQKRDQGEGEGEEGGGPQQ